MIIGRLVQENNTLSQQISEEFVRKDECTFAKKHIIINAIIINAIIIDAIIINAIIINAIIINTILINAIIMSLYI